MKKLIYLLLSGVMILSVFAGCGGGASSGSGKTASFSINEDVQELDPTMNVYNTSSTVLQNLFRGLYKLDPNNNPVPALADSFTLDPTNTVYTFKLRPNIKWSDGSPLTAHDFEYSIKRVCNPDVASKAANDISVIVGAQDYYDKKATADQVGVKALDDNTLQITLTAPIPYFLQSLCTTSFYPVKKDVVEAGDDWKKDASKYVCDGPFMLKEISPNDKYVMVKNPNYIDASQVKLDGVTAFVMQTPEAELAAYQNNEIDVSKNPSAQAIQQFKNSAELHPTDKLNLYYFDVNVTNKPFDDPRVRKALSEAIDRNTIINNILQMPYKVADGVLPPQIFDLTDPTKPFSSTAGNLVKEDVNDAKQLLSDAGFPNGQGFPAINFMTTTSQTNKDIAQAVQSMWKDNLGIETNITTYESSVYWTEQENGGFDIMYDGWTGDYLDPMTFMDLFDAQRQSYQTRWANDDYTQLIAANKATGDQKVRMDNFVKAEQILMDNMPVIPIYFGNEPYLCKPNLQGVFKNFIGHLYFEYAYFS